VGSAPDTNRGVNKYDDKILAQGLKGLVDSEKVKSDPGKRLSLTAKLAPNEAATVH
jgi:hypothetical protein